ncbi:MAG: hypothetical protein ABII18_04185 [bacterium]|nr:hypothetical protein [bacterium]MBU1918312.1 hypothetical protein [bacterium]
MDTQYQLYDLLNKLSLLVDNKDELGNIVGCAVIASLIDFSTQSGALQDIHFEQINVIYQKLEETLNQCKSTDSFQALCELNVKVHDFFKDFNHDQELGSPLLKRIMFTLEKRHGVHEDILRRNGLALFNAIIERGPLQRKVDYLKQDYRLLEGIFGT